MNSAIFGFTNNMIIYRPKKRKNCNTDIIDASPIWFGSRQCTQKTEIIIVYYNKRKGGVDKVDEMEGSYSVSRISARWRLIFVFLIECCRNK